MSEPNTLEEWLVGRPPRVAHLARQYPPGTRLSLFDRDWWVVSYNEEGLLGISPVDPSLYYQGALREREHIHAHHVPGFEPFPGDPGPPPHTCRYCTEPPE